MSFFGVRRDLMPGMRLKIGENSRRLGIYIAENKQQIVLY